MDSKATIKTRFEELVFPTSDPDEMTGRYLAADAVREWPESFLDEDSGEVVSVNRHEIIMARGTFLSPDEVSSLMFYIQCGEIKTVSVSNVKRCGACIEVGKNTIWKITISGGGCNKKRKYILYAQSLDQALTIGRDYLEQTLRGAFKIEAAKSYTSCIVIPEDNMKKAAVDSEGNIIAEDAAPMIPEFYTIVTTVKTKDFTKGFTWLVLATSVDDAKSRINKYIDERVQNSANDGNGMDAWEDYELTVLSGTGASINCVIPKEFSEAYFKWEEAEKALHDPDKFLKAIDKELSKQ